MAVELVLSVVEVDVMLLDRCEPECSVLLAVVPPDVVVPDALVPELVEALVVSELLLDPVDASGPPGLNGAPPQWASTTNQVTAPTPIFLPTGYLASDRDPPRARPLGS